MYFPNGLPQEFRFPKDSNESLSPLVISSNRDRSLFLLLTENTLHIWFCKPCVQITALQRSVNSIETTGKNVNAVWKSDATTILVTTDKGGLLFFKLDFPEDSDNQKSLYLKKGFPRRQNLYDAPFNGEGIPALTLRQLHAHNIGHQISSLATLKDELVVCTVSGDLIRMNWDCKINTECSTKIKDLHFSHSLQLSKGQHLVQSLGYVQDLEYSPLLGGYAAVLSDGRGFFLTAPNSKFDSKNLHGVWAPDLRDACCVHVNHKYRLMVFGCQSGKGMVFHIEPANATLVLTHELKVPCKDYPDAGVIGGTISRLAWTPDECAIVAAWSKGGFAVWSVFGALLFCSVQSYLSIQGTQIPDRMVVKTMEWGAEGYQLWMSIYQNGQTLPQNNENHEDNSTQPTCARGSFDFIQISFVKSPLTVNPCLANHKHLYLQGEDRLYINIGHDKGGLDGQSSNILIANKQWRVVPVRYSYLGSTWPIRYSAMDEEGSNIAIAGRYGLAHFSLTRRKWTLFGNEAQEKNMVVSGGLLWWNDFVCAGCFNIFEKQDEIRFYPSSQKLDNSYCTSSKVPYPILLVNSFEDFLVCLCSDRHIMIFSLLLKSSSPFPRVELKRIQEVSVDGFIPHPMCVTCITLSTLKAEIVLNQSENSHDSQKRSDLPESILMNVAGRLLMFQRDWSRPQPKVTTNKFRPVPFCNPLMVASSVENLWIPVLENEGSKNHTTNALWLSCGAAGMKVWLNLSAQEPAKSQNFMSKRNMLPFEIDIYPLAVLADDAVILGAACDHVLNKAPVIPCSSGSCSTTYWPNFCTLERTSQIYLHQVLRQLLRQNLGFHALCLARCFTSLPYFSHILELLLHKVLEEEATSKEPIPDPLLPRVVAFAKEFSQYRETIVHCARKTEIALWGHLFSTVGSPKALFEECLMAGDLNTAASYLIILQNLEKYYVSRQHATLLLEAVLENRNWALARDVVRHLKAIDPTEAELEPVIRHPPNRYTQQRFGTAASAVDADLDDMYVLSKPPLVRNASLSYYDTEARMKEKTPRADTNAQPVARKSSVSQPKSDLYETHNIDTLLYKHAKKLLMAYRIRDLGLFAANLEDYELVAFLRKERIRGTKIENPVEALKQLHDDFMWPLPVLTHSAFHSLEGYKIPRPKLNIDNSIDIVDYTEAELDGSQTVKEILLTPINFLNSGIIEEDLVTEGTSGSYADDAENSFPAEGLSRTSSESQLHLLSLELATRGPPQSELELRYFYQVMVEAEYFEWTFLISIILRDPHLFKRAISTCSSLADSDIDYLGRLCTNLTQLNIWINSECLGYRPFISTVSDYIDSLVQLNARYASKVKVSTTGSASIRLATTSTEIHENIASNQSNTAENTTISQSESCSIS